MKRLVDWIVTVVVLIAVAFGAIYGYLHYDKVRDIYGDLERKITQDDIVSANSDNAISTMSYNATATADGDSFYLQVPLTQLGRQYIYCPISTKQYQYDNFLNIPTRTETKNFKDYKIYCDVELQFYPNDVHKRFVLVVRTAIMARTFWNHPEIVEFTFCEDKEYKFENQSQYELLKSEKPSYEVMIRDNDVHFKCCYMKKWTKDYIYHITPFYYFNYNSFAPNYTLSTVAKTENPDDISGNIDNPEEPTNPQPENPRDAHEIKDSIDWQRLDKFFNWPIGTTKKVITYIGYALLGLSGLIVLALIIKPIKWIFGGK